MKHSPTWLVSRSASTAAQMFFFSRLSENHTTFLSVLLFFLSVLLSPHRCRSVHSTQRHCCGSSSECWPSVWAVSCVIRDSHVAWNFSGTLGPWDPGTQGPSNLWDRFFRRTAGCSFRMKWKVLVSFGDSSFACWSTYIHFIQGGAASHCRSANSILLVELEPIWKRSKFPWISWFSDSKQLPRTELSRHPPGTGNPSSVFASPWVECRAAGRVMVGGMEEQGNEVLVTCSKSYFFESLSLS